MMLANTCFDAMKREDETCEQSYHTITYIIRANLNVKMAIYNLLYKHMSSKAASVNKLTWQKPWLNNIQGERVNKFNLSEYKQWEKTMGSLPYKQPIMYTQKIVLSPSHGDCILFSKTYCSSL